MTSETLTPQRRPGRVGPLHVLQLLVIEAAVLGLLTALGQGVVVLAVVGTVSLILLVVMFARHRGRWWVEGRLLKRHFRLRHRTVAGRAADVRLVALRTLA